MCREDVSARSFAIIEDKFLTGFKLKLLEILFRGDVAATFCDLKEEVEWLGLSPRESLVQQVNSTQELVRWFVRARDSGIIPGDLEIQNQKEFLEQRYSWDQVTRRIYSEMGLL
ncbi:MAG: hypothetical protein CML06_00790 [Pseudomonadales bacterium]|nr:hypothetical protein [Pseudomonadales bacterium]